MQRSQGYGDTQARGKTNYDAILAAIVLPALEQREEPERAAHLRGAISAALADPDGAELRRYLEEIRPLAPVG